MRIWNCFSKSSDYFTIDVIVHSFPDPQSNAPFHGLSNQLSLGFLATSLWKSTPSTRLTKLVTSRRFLLPQALYENKQGVADSLAQAWAAVARELGMIEILFPFCLHFNSLKFDNLYFQCREGGRCYWLRPAQRAVVRRRFLRRASPSSRTSWPQTALPSLRQAAHRDQERGRGGLGPLGGRHLGALGSPRRPRRLLVSCVFAQQVSALALASTPLMAWIDRYRPKQKCIWDILL